MYIWITRPLHVEYASNTRTNSECDSCDPAEDQSGDHKYYIQPSVGQVVGAAVHLRAISISLKKKLECSFKTFRGIGTENGSRKGIGGNVRPFE